jgi:hypothetical protein
VPAVGTPTVAASVGVSVVRAGRESVTRSA